MNLIELEALRDRVNFYQPHDTEEMHRALIEVITHLIEEKEDVLLKMEGK